MPTPIYKQKPFYPALITGLASLILSLFCFAMIYQRVQSGDLSESALKGLIMLSICITGLCLILGFARYQFTHLWMPSRKRPHGHHRKKTRRM